MDCTKYIEIYIQQIEFFIQKDNYEAADLVMNNPCFSSVYAKVKLLLYFSASGNKKVVVYLLSKGCNVNVQDSTGRTSLMMAAKNGHITVIKILLEAGADIFLLDNENKSALHVFCEENIFDPDTAALFYPELCKKFSTVEEIARCLIDAKYLLYKACCFKNYKIIEYMLESGFPVNSTDPQTKQSALHIAVSNEDINTVKLLLKYGANVNARDVYGSTPLFYIYQYGHTSKQLELLKMFLKLNVKTTSNNDYGGFQISQTLANGNHEAISAVLQSNIDFTARDHCSGKNVLHYLAMNTNPGVVEELKYHVNRYDINVIDNSGISPLHVAVIHRNTYMVEFLLEQGAKPNAKSSLYGYTPLYYAFEEFKPGFEKQCNPCVELLLSNGADPQFIVSDKYKKPITVFDVAKKTNSLNLTRPVIAQLAIIDGLGVQITEIISTKFDLHLPQKKYYNRCQKLIRKNIYGNIKLINLLTGDKKKIAQYSGNKKLMLKLTYLSYKPKLKTTYSYYYNIVKNSFSKGIQYRRSLNEIAGVVCKIFGDTIHTSHLIVNKIINYLDDKGSLALYQLSQDINV